MRQAELKRKAPLRPRRSPRKCRQCGERYTPMSTTQTACSPRCALELVAKEKIKKDRARSKTERAKLRERRERLKPLSQVCAETQRDVNRYIMARDRAAGYPCISCGDPSPTEAGHYFHAGSKYRTSRFRFSHAVINAQCHQCNVYRGGNQHGYRIGYIERYGEDSFNALLEEKRRADRGELAPLTKEEARQIAAEHRAMTRAIKKRSEQ